jgi:hypothetical protein
MGGDARRRGPVSPPNAAVIEPSLVSEEPNPLYLNSLGLSKGKRLLAPTP